MRKSMVSLLALPFLLATPPSELMAQADRIQAFAAESRLWIDGGSTVRDWTCTTGAFQGTLDYAPGADPPGIDDLDAAVRRLDLRIPVAEIDCGSDTMHEHMRKALKWEEHPQIRFRMERYAVAPAGAGVRVDLRGDLTIAGTTRAQSAVATVTRTENGNLRVQGSVPLDMTEFGVEPPRLMLGTLRVRDDVLVRFDLVLRPLTTGGNS